MAIRYGRVGTRGQVQQFAATRASDLQRLVQDRLQKRLSAHRRIGCAYRLVLLDLASGFDASPWLPPEIMARFC